jgi:TPR repeat protein
MERFLNLEPHEGSCAQQVAKRTASHRSGKHLALIDLEDVVRMPGRAGDGMTNDMSFHVKALKEVDEGHMVPKLWAIALADQGGDPNRAKARYMKLRVLDLNIQQKESANAQQRRAAAAAAAAAATPVTGGAPSPRVSVQSRAMWPRPWVSAAGIVALVAATQLLPIGSMNPLASPRMQSVNASIEPDARERQTSRLLAANQMASEPAPVDAMAQTTLGDQYYGGRGVAKDHAAAATWYGKAAEQGFAKAQINLAVMYKFGEGMPRDYAKSANWFRKAADQGDATAQVNLGLLYEFGQGVAQDDAAAATWYRKAADQGDARALAYLGSLYEAGRGVSQDYVEAYTLWSLAIARTPAWETELEAEAVKNRDNVAAKMTSGQIAQAQKLSRDWKPRSPASV